MSTILHISKYYSPDRGGIETVAKYLAEGMTGYRNIVVCFSTDRQYHEDVVCGIPVYRVPANFSFMSQDVAFSYYGIPKMLFRRYQPDFCHLHCPNPFVYPLVLHLLSRETKLVLHWHSDILGKGLMYTLVQPLENAILRRSDCILATSSSYVRGSRPLHKYPSKVRIAPNGLDTSTLDLKPGEEERVAQVRRRYGDRPIVFFVGRHIPYKGIEYLIQAEPFIASDCVILIAGQGPEDKRLKPLSCSDRVHLTGSLSDDDLRICYHAAHVFAFPSKTKAEAFGIALAEAMYCRCAPVVFTLPGSGINGVSLNGVTGAEVPLGDVHAFARAIDELIQDPGLRRRYAEAARQRIAANFTTAHAVHRLEEIYAGL